MVFAQVCAAMARSACVMGNCTSFSASAKVAAETAGPTVGPSPNAEGIPAGTSPGCCAWTRLAAADARRNSEVSVRNCRRDLDMLLPITDRATRRDDTGTPDD